MVKKSKPDIEKWIVNWISEQLKIDAETIDLDEPFVNLGMSSRQAVFLSGELGDFLEDPEELSPSLVWDYPTISKIAAFLANRD